jgi:hypothetical protein
VFSVSRPGSRDKGTGVLGIGDAILIGIVLGTPIVVLDAISIFGQIWTLIDVVRHAIVIGIVLTGSPSTS